jgi:hypothetical protein
VASANYLDAPDTRCSYGSIRWLTVPVCAARERGGQKNIGRADVTGVDARHALALKLRGQLSLARRGGLPPFSSGSNPFKHSVLMYRPIGLYHRVDTRSR